MQMLTVRVAISGADGLTERTFPIEADGRRTTATMAEAIERALRSTEHLALRWPESARTS